MPNTANSFSVVDGGDSSAGSAMNPVDTTQTKFLRVVKGGVVYMIPLFDGLSLTLLGRLLIEIDGGAVADTDLPIKLVNWNS